MSFNPLDIFGVHTVTLSRTVQTPYGFQPGEETTVTGCFVVERIHQVRAKDGTLVASSAQIAMPPETHISMDEETLITLPSGRTGRVLSVARSNPDGLPMPDYVEVSIE